MMEFDNSPDQERTRPFVAYDIFGNPYVIEAVRHYNTVSDRRGNNWKEPGMWELETRDGKTVERIEKGRYRIFDMGTPIVLTSTDENAT